MEWEGIDIGNSSSIGTNYDFNQRQRVLRVKQPGSYFIYLNLSLKSTDVAHSTDGEVKVTLKFSDGQLLTCKVKLTDDSAVQERCFAVVQHLGPDSHINAEMSVHRSADGWKLVSNESGFGMFLVDSP